jgi:hypothetical protein
MVLLRYNFLIFFIFSLILFVMILNKKKVVDYVYLTLSILLIVAWVFANHNLNGSWGLSNSEGKHLYNRIVWKGDTLPDYKNPSLMKLKSLVDYRHDLHDAWWGLEPFLTPVNKLKNETESSKLLGEVAIQALLYDPVKYLSDIPQFYLIAHGNRQPYHDDLYTTGRYMGRISCRILGNIHFCTPVINIKITEYIWNFIIFVGDIYYKFFPIWINIFIFFPIFIYSIFQENKFIRFTAIIYFLSSLIPILVEEPGTRYLYPLYPIKFILIGFSLGIFWMYIKKRSGKFRWD